MQIEILELLAGARKAEGLAVVIDVFRAFSVACYLTENGAQEIIPVGELEQAYKLKEENPDIVLIGEREGKVLPGFDYGNSPTETKGVEFTGKTIVHTTSAGTQGLVNARGAEEIITGSFVNAGAIVNYIRNKTPEKVCLVAMGTGGVESADEDLYCARYLKSCLEGEPLDFTEIVSDLRKRAGSNFFDPEQDWLPEGDFNSCLDLDRFDFVLKAERKKDGLLYLQKMKSCQ